jgi:hypothetical protein
VADKYKERSWKTLKLHMAENREKYYEMERKKKNMIRYAKRILGKNLASEQDKNNRKFARIIKSKTKAQSTFGPLLTSGKRLITDDKEMAAELNNYFSIVFKRETRHDMPEAKEEEITTEILGVTITRHKIKKR